MDITDIKQLNQYVIFIIDDQRYALQLSAVERIIPVVEITPLPKAPEIVLGIINVEGQIIPVIDMRRRFRLPEREMELSDQLIIARTSRKLVALIVDTVEGVIEHSSQETIPPERILAGMEYIEGVIKFEDGLVLIHDLDKFLSLEEEQELDKALKKKR